MNGTMNDPVSQLIPSGPSALVPKAADALPRSGFEWRSSRKSRFRTGPVSLLVTLTALGMAAGVTSIQAQTTNGVSGSSYEGFQLIAERNIFNPNRSPRRERPSNIESEGPREQPVRSESFALLGTLSSDQGRFAFFDGSSAEYHQVLKPADTIAGYLIADISQTFVKLETNGRNINLPVGMQMSRTGDAEWLVTARPESSREGGSGDGGPGGFRRSPDAGNSRGDFRGGSRGDSRSRSRNGSRGFSNGSSTGASNGPSSSASSAASSEEESEVLKLLMQKREQELKNEKK
jgi:hypothetical protein